MDIKLLEDRLNRLGLDKIARPKIRKLDLELDRALQEWAEISGITFGKLLDIYRKFHQLTFERDCDICGTQFDLRDGRISAFCSHSCQMVGIHRNYSEEQKQSIAERKRQKDREWKENGKSSEHSKKAFETRRKKYSEEELKDQYRRIAETQRNRREAAQAVLRKLYAERIRHIIEKKSPSLVLRMVSMYLYGPTHGANEKVYDSWFKFLRESDLHEFEQFDNELWRKYIRIGPKAISNCEQCGKLIDGDRIYCSQDCVYKSEGYRKRKSEKSKEVWQREGHRELQLELLCKRHEQTPLEIRKEWSRKMLSSMSPEDIIARRDAALRTKLERGVIACAPIWEEGDPLVVAYKQYVNQVEKYTKRNKVMLEGHENTSRDTFHVDHIFPKQKGFIFGIHPSLIGSLGNLRILDAFTNQSKGSKITEVPKFLLPYLPDNWRDYAEDPKITL